MWNSKAYFFWSNLCLIIGCVMNFDLNPLDEYPTGFKTVIKGNKTRSKLKDFFDDWPDRIKLSTVKSEGCNKGVTLYGYIPQCQERQCKTYTIYCFGTNEIKTIECDALGYLIGDLPYCAAITGQTFDIYTVSEKGVATTKQDLCYASVRQGGTTIKFRGCPPLSLNGYLTNHTNEDPCKVVCSGSNEAQSLNLDCTDIMFSSHLPNCVKVTPSQTEHGHQKCYVILKPEGTFVHYPGCFQPLLVNGHITGGSYEESCKIVCRGDYKAHSVTCTDGYFDKSLPECAKQMEFGRSLRGKSWSIYRRPYVKPTAVPGTIINPVIKNYRIYNTKEKGGALIHVRGCQRPIWIRGNVTFCNDYGCNVFCYGSSKKESFRCSKIDNIYETRPTRCSDIIPLEKMVDIFRSGGVTPSISENTVAINDWAVMRIRIPGCDKSFVVRGHAIKGCSASSCKIICWGMTKEEEPFHCYYGLLSGNLPSCVTAVDKSQLFLESFDPDYVEPQLAGTLTTIPGCDGEVVLQGTMSDYCDKNSCTIICHPSYDKYTITCSDRKYPEKLPYCLHRRGTVVQLKGCNQQLLVLGSLVSECENNPRCKIICFGSTRESQISCDRMYELSKLPHCVKKIENEIDSTAFLDMSSQDEARGLDDMLRNKENAPAFEPRNKDLQVARIDGCYQPLMYYGNITNDCYNEECTVLCFGKHKETFRCRAGQLIGKLPSCALTQVQNYFAIDDNRNRAHHCDVKNTTEGLYVNVKGCEETLLVKRGMVKRYKASCVLTCTDEPWLKQINLVCFKDKHFSMKLPLCATRIGEDNLKATEGGYSPHWSEEYPAIWEERYKPV